MKPKLDPFSPLDVRYLGERRWVLLKDLVFKPTGERAKAGLETDFASIPKLLHFKFSPYGPWAKAAIFHDDGYQHAHERTEALRKKIDKRFLMMMEASGVSWLKRILIYRAVRDFGAIVFHRKR